MGYVARVGNSISQMGNAILGGSEDESISSRCGKQLPRCRLCRWLCLFLNWLDKGHCVEAIELDEGETRFQSAKV